MNERLVNRTIKQFPLDMDDGWCLRRHQGRVYRRIGGFVAGLYMHSSSICYSSSGGFWACSKAGYPAP